MDTQAQAHQTSLICKSSETQPVGQLGLESGPIELSEMAGTDLPTPDKQDPIVL